MGMRPSRNVWHARNRILDEVLSFLIRDQTLTKTLLIGGSGRSGTTILCRTMGRHPLVTDVPEWRFPSDPDGVIDFYTQSVEGIQSPFHFDVRLKRLGALLSDVADRGPIDRVLGSARFRRWSMNAFRRNLSPAYARTNAVDFSPNFQQLSAELIDTLTSFTYLGYWVGMSPFEKASLSFSDGTRDQIRSACQTFLESVAADVCSAQGVKYHLEKNTWSILCWDRTLEVLPDAKLVHIVRDPRDVVASYRGQSWVPTDASQAARLLASIMGRWDDISRCVPSDSYFEVRLEDLVRNPESHLRQICDFWDLNWDDSLLETKFSTGSFGRWQYDLSPQDSESVSELLAPAMTKYGYA